MLLCLQVKIAVGNTDNFPLLTDQIIGPHHIAYNFPDGGCPAGSAQARYPCLCVRAGEEGAAAAG